MLIKHQVINTNQGIISEIIYFHDSMTFQDNFSHCCFYRIFLFVYIFKYFISIPSSSNVDEEIFSSCQITDMCQSLMLTERLWITG